MRPRNRSTATDLVGQRLRVRRQQRDESLVPTRRKFGLRRPRSMWPAARGAISSSTFRQRLQLYRQPGHWRVQRAVRLSDRNRNGSGGTTYAYFYSTSHATVTGNATGSSATVNGHPRPSAIFRSSISSAQSDGTDSVTLDSLGGTFVGTPDFSYVSGTSGGASFLIGALYAASVIADAAGSTDTAVFYSYASNTFSGAPSSSSLTGSTTNAEADVVQLRHYGRQLRWRDGVRIRCRHGRRPISLRRGAETSSARRPSARSPWARARSR